VDRIDTTGARVLERIDTAGGRVGERIDPDASKCVGENRHCGRKDGGK
jgi:hypothetical protein